MYVEIRLGTPVLRDSGLFARWIRGTLAALVMTNCATLRRFPEFPWLYRSGVRYREEPEGVESFVDAPIVLRRGHGDCAHLAAWRLAELIERKGERAHLRIKWAPSRKVPGRKLFHVQVRRADGRIEDPSRRLGMGSEE